MIDNLIIKKNIKLLLFLKASNKELNLKKTLFWLLQFQIEE